MRQKFLPGIHLRKTGFSLRILVAGERGNVTGEYFERGSTSEKKNSYRLLNVCWRILHGKWRILQSPMPNEHPGREPLSFFLHLIIV